MQEAERTAEGRGLGLGNSRHQEGLWEKAAHLSRGPTSLYFLGQTAMAGRLVAGGGGYHSWMEG